MKRFVAFVLALVLMTIGCSTSLAAGKTRSTDESIQRYSVLVIDTSDSATFLSGGVTIYTASTALNYVKKAANSFLSDLVNAAGENYVAVVTFDSNSSVLSGFTQDISSVKSKVEKLSAHDTVRSIDAGLDAAYSLLDGISDPDAIKNVVLVTTGMTNGGAHSYTGKYDTSTVGSNWFRTNTGVHLYAYANGAHISADKIKQKATLYVLGLFQTMDGMPSEGKDVAQFFRLTASDLATSTDHFYDVEDPDNIDFAFGEIADDILSGYPVIHGSFNFRGEVDALRVSDSKDRYDSEADYYYTDGYFFTDADKANPSLATMSLALELSAFSSYEQENWYNPNYSPSDPRFFQDRLVNVKTLLLGNQFAEEPKYATKDGFSGIGFTNFDANEFWEADPLKDSIGVCAAMKEIKSPKGDPYTLVAVVVRGGGYGSEWASNFTLGSSGDHDGFATARDNTLKWLNSYLRDHGITNSDKLKLWIVGYSRAGITANMVAGAIDADTSKIKYGQVSIDDIYCYTFEAPQGIVKSANGGVYKNIHNYRNLNDLVPMVAPTVWDFTRYNKANDIIFPNAYTNGRTYSSFHNDMKQQLRDMHFADFADNYGIFTAYKSDPAMGYSILNQMVVRDFKVDKSKFLPGGDPLWWFEDRSAATTTLLQNGVDYLFDGMIQERPTYAYRMESTVRLLTGILMHYDGALAGVSAELTNGVKVKFDIGHFIDCTADLFTLDNIAYIFGPMVELNLFYSYDERIEDVKTRAMEVVSKCYAEYAFLFTAVQFKSFIDALGEIVVDACLDIAKDLWNNNTNDINTLTSLISVFQTMGFQGHFPEVTLAWVRSLDPNYNENAKTPSPNTTTRIIRINCPVDVYVYDKNGTLCACFKDEQASFEDNNLVHFVNTQDEKVIYLPGDTEYSIQIVARDNGVVNVSLGEHNFTYSSITRLRNYFDINVNKNDEIMVHIAAIDEAEQVENSPNGSTALYTLLHNGVFVEYDEEFRGEQVPTHTHHLTLKTEGTGGYVDGAGDFLQGYFAKAEAYTLPDGTFLGWYQNGQLVSEDLVFRFAMLEDTTLVAKFNDVDLYHLQVKTAEGGSVAETDSYFTKDMEIGLLATPDVGWTFNGWTVEGAGKIKEASAANTTFVMEAGDAVITAHFKRTPITITFDANGGTASIGFMQTQEGKLAYLPTAVWEGYVFDGWFTAADGGEMITTETIFDTSTTVFAHWSKQLPPTGDNSNIFLWLSLMSFSGLLLLSMNWKRKESY